MQATLLQLVVKGIPESFLSVLLIYIISQTKFEKIKYVLITIIYIISTFFIRMLPIGPGVNTIIGFSLLIVIMIIISGAQPPKTILAAIISILVIVICEFLNIIYILLIYGEKTANTVADGKNPLDPVYKTIITMPSTLFLTIFVILIHLVMKYLINNKKGKEQIKKDINGKIGE